MVCRHRKPQISMSWMQVRLNRRASSSNGMGEDGRLLAGVSVGFVPFDAIFPPMIILPVCIVWGAMGSMELELDVWSEG